MKKFGILLIAIALAMLVSCASAATMDHFETKKIDMGGYTVTIPDISEIKTPATRSSQTIIQGETDWFSVNVNGDYTRLRVDLNWGDSSDSLRIKVHSADDYTFGFYYDTFDSSTPNGRIVLNIDNDDGIAEGTWYYEVNGYSVTGTEDYTINTYLGSA
jgi:hypothetical protein